MIDLLEDIRRQPEAYRHAIAEKGMTLNLDTLLATDTAHRKLLMTVERARRTRNAASDRIAKTPAGPARDALIASMREEKEHRRADETRLSELEKELQALLVLVPNIPAADAPRGEGEASYRVVSQWGTPPSFPFTARDHATLGTLLDLLDTERGTAVSGFRGYFLKNEAVLLQHGILTLALQKLFAEGFTLMVPPTIVKHFALEGSGYFPFGTEEIYRIVSAAHYGEKVETPEFLVGTAEPSLLAYYANDVLEEAELPKLLCGISPCYRSEAGSYGRDTKGIYRVHEFFKVEQVVLCQNDLAESERWFAKIRKNAEAVVRALELPYRIVEISTGDMGAGKYRMQDIETWMPSRNAYGETHSNSLLTDWQARRLNIRYRDRTGKLHFIHTLNNTAIASPRILIPLLEVHQQEDGSVHVPDALQQYVGCAVIAPK